MRSRGVAAVQPAESPILAGVEDSKKKRGGGWILMDAVGGESMVNMDKYGVMQRARINARDLRVIDPVLAYPSAIFGREKAIVLNLEHIKAIITPDEVLLRNSPDERIVPVIEELRRRLSPASKESPSHFDGGDHPFEIRVLEIVLEAICSSLSARTTELENDVYPALDLLTSKISVRNLEHVRKLKSQMTRLTARVHKVQDELEKLLDDEEDMASLYLSRKAGRPTERNSARATGFRTSSSSTGGPEIREASSMAASKVLEQDNVVVVLEMLLEDFYSNIEETLDKLSMLREYIESTEDFLNIQLDNLRNQLIKVDLLLNSAFFALSVFTLVTSIFGMSIPYQWNTGHGYLFKWVNIIGMLASVAIYALIYFYARYKGVIIS